MTNAERAIVAVVVVTAVMAVLYLVGRARAGDLDWRRDLVRMVILVGIAIAVVALFALPEAVVLLVFPAILILGGAYLARTRTDRFTRTVGWLTMAVGVLTAVQALIRIFVLP